MKKLLRGIRGVVGTGVVWGVAWALVGLLIGVTSVLLPGLPWDAFFAIFDAPLPALAVPGFVGGVLFSTVLAIAGRRRRFEELSLPRFAAWGGVAGLLLSAIPFAIGTPNAETPLWLLGAAIVGPMTLLSAISAAVSLALARKAEKGELPA